MLVVPASTHISGATTVPALSALTIAPSTTSSCSSKNYNDHATGYHASRSAGVVTPVVALVMAP